MCDSEYLNDGDRSSKKLVMIKERVTFSQHGLGARNAQSLACPGARPWLSPALAHIHGTLSRTGVLYIALSCTSCVVLIGF